MANHRNKTLIFLHIPKAAGSTLARIIRRQYHPATIYEHYPGKVSYVVPPTTAVQAAHLRFAKLESLSHSQREKISVLMGHDGFGLHELIPQPCTYITMLRDPIDRVISHYYYVLRSPNNYLHQTVVSNQMSLEEYVSANLSPELDNGQTKYLAGLTTPYLNFGDYPTTILEAAKKNLQEQFIVVGLTERFDETLILLKKALAWQTPFYAKANVSHGRLRKRDLPADTLKVIAAYNELDMELYKFAQAMFEEQIHRHGPSFSSELRAFTILNRAYGWYDLVYTAVHRQMKKTLRLNRRVVTK